MSRRVVSSIAALVAVLVAGDAAADNRRAPADIRAILGAKTLAGSTLVGRSGQLFVPRAEGGWKRKGRGGIACDIRGAFELSGTLWGVCSWAPLFVRSGGVWSARPLTNRGRTRVSRAGNQVVLSIGRHVYTWSGEWKRRSSAPRRIRSLHAESSSRWVAVTRRRGLLRGRGRRWSEVVKAPDRRDKRADPPVRVFGSSAQSYAVSRAGVLSRVGSRSLAPVKLPAGVSAVEIGATWARPGGEVLAAAVVRRGSKRDSAIATLSGGQLKLSKSPAPAGARVGLIAEIGGELLLANRRGQVFVRGADGSWSEPPLINEPPPRPQAAAANGGPAPTR